MGALQPLIGKVTFESEGAERGPYHSRVLHVPTLTSGLTLGRGYDMKMKNPFKIYKDLTNAGLKKTDAKKLSIAAGLSGNTAKTFIKNHNLEKFEITQRQQVNLFNISYKNEEAETKRLCSKMDVVNRYGKCDWDKLDSAIKQILVDLKFRGDYTGVTRKFIQKHVVANDTKAFLNALSDKSKWTSQRIPTDRFQRRITFFKIHSSNQRGQSN